MRRRASAEILRTSQSLWRSSMTESSRSRTAFARSSTTSRSSSVVLVTAVSIPGRSAGLTPKLVILLPFKPTSIVLLTAMHAVDRMPVELWTRAFGCLDLIWIIRAAHVCRSWRLLAFDDFLFWRNIRIDNVSAPAMDLAYYQLAMGYGRTITLDIDFQHKHELVRTRLIPLLRSAASRTRRLAISIESLYRLDIEDALCQEAPLLEYLHLRYEADPPDLHLTMPLGKGKQLLANQTGNLRRVHLTNMILPSEPNRAFAQATEVFSIMISPRFRTSFPAIYGTPFRI